MAIPTLKTRLLPRPAPFNFGSAKVLPETKEDILKIKMLSLGIPESEIIRIAKDINALIPKPTGLVITSKEYSLLTQEQKIQFKDAIIILSKTEYDDILNELIKILNLLKYMSGDNVRKLYDDIKKEQQTGKGESIRFTIVRSPLSNRLIAHVTELRWNGVDLLSGQNIMLYQSTGESRETGLAGYWMPYMGERDGGNVAKLEDEYIMALNNFINSDTDRDILDHYKPLLIDMIRNISTYNNYMRFINKTYLIASFLLSSNSDEYISNPANHKYIREYNYEEKVNAIRYLYNKIEENRKHNSFINYIPITAEIIDDIIKQSQEGAVDKSLKKYLKYKAKYLALKTHNL